MFSVRFYVKIISGDKMKSLYDFNYEEMSELALEHGWKKFRGHQIFQWLYRKRVTSIDDMSDFIKRYKRSAERKLSVKAFRVA